MAISIPTQPDLPPEGEMTEMERVYISECPPGLWPENQDSNFGAHRKCIADVFQEVYDEIVEISNNTFVATANRWLYMWESQMGLPINPPGRTLEQRRNRVRVRMLRGPFTWGLRHDVIASVLALPASGPVPEFTAAGIPFDLTQSDDRGIPLYAETEITVEMFHVDEMVEQFHYRVGITDGVIYDPVTLTRELLRITPAGITFEIGTDYVKTGGAGSPASGGGPKATT
jgi:hypothetical protein